MALIVWLAGSLTHLRSSDNWATSFFRFIYHFDSHNGQDREDQKSWLELYWHERLIITAPVAPALADLGFPNESVSGNLRVKST